jgi:hypothetical protein
MVQSIAVEVGYWRSNNLVDKRLIVIEKTFLPGLCPDRPCEEQERETEEEELVHEVRGNRKMKTETSRGQTRGSEKC